MIDIMLVDDHDLVRTAVKRLLSDIFGVQVVAEANTGEEAISILRNLGKFPDVILLDSKMPGIGGLEATRKFLQINPDSKILIVTAYNSYELAFRFLQAGALGYMTKGTGAEEMIKAIRAIHVGQRYISPDMTSKFALKHLDKQVGSPIESLSERELQIMLMIIKGNKPQEIAKKLCLSTKTVSSYRYRVFDKLKVSNYVELTLLALRYNLLEPEDI